MLGNTIKVNDYSSRNLGLFCKQLPMWPIAIESKDALTVGGRLSNLYTSAHHFNDITVEIEAVLLGLNVDLVASYFSDGKRLSFSHIPDRYGIIRQLVAIDQTRVGNGAIELRITLKCDPFKYSTANQTLEFTNASNDFDVSGNFYAEPVLFAQGCIDGFTVDVNGNELVTSGLTGNIYIDVTRRMVYQLSHGVKTIVNDHTTGDIWNLCLVPDDLNYLDFSGATKVEITKNERWL